MEQNLPVMAKRVWSVFRVIFFMLRKGISKKKLLLLDLNLVLKRGNKIATKAIANLMTFHHHHHLSSFAAATAPPREYEFSCSNTPAFHLPNKRRFLHHPHNLFAACAFHAPPTLDDDASTIDAVKLALEMLTNNNSNNANNNDQFVVDAVSPMLPGFGPSPMVRQLRITDSPFPLRDHVDDSTDFVDKKAEEFIQRFYKELKQQH